MALDFLINAIKAFYPNLKENAEKINENGVVIQMDENEKDNNGLLIKVFN